MMEVADGAKPRLDANKAATGALKFDMHARICYLVR